MLSKSIKLHFRELSRWKKSIYTRIMFGCGKCEYKVTEKTTLIRHIRRSIRSAGGSEGWIFILFMLKYSQGINVINYNSTNGQCVQISEPFRSHFSKKSEFGPKVRFSEWVGALNRCKNSKYSIYCFYRKILKWPLKNLFVYQYLKLNGRHYI